MFTKSLVLVLLGCTLILASPVQQSGESRAKRSFIGTIADWLQKIDDTIDNVTDRVKQPVKKVYDAILKQGEGVVGYGKDTINEVLEKYYELKSKSEASINKAKNTFLTKVIDELQKVIDFLSESDSEDLEKLKEKTQDIAQSGKDALEKLKHQLQEAIEAEKLKLEQNLGKWEEEAKEAVNARKY
ncbi:uncharacterized protein LOC107980733 [Nasonia vitripennis]|uniref:Uncharacterized protein n=1 Tax=Nasonia vitripennis TaxID=7425 RepID=A0A7M7IRB0_NASVI|nr:uncharacterized protein LOC107980733 [Nasonia vitripennis]